MRYRQLCQQRQRLHTRKASEKCYPRFSNSRLTRDAAVFPFDETVAEYWTWISSPAIRLRTVAVVQREPAPLYYPQAQAFGNRGADESALHLWETRGIMKRTFLVLAILLLAAAVPAQTPPPLISPEVHSDRRVTFHFRGPNVKEVAVSLEGDRKSVV